MKILELRFRNLNSLYGEWFIDFTNPEYSSNGIFALTGPTGAGKTTILDAICLALYGTTPRLGKLTKSTNELMSRQTGDCYAELLFESQAGRYRCNWSQHRAWYKADGKLLDATHEISDAMSGELIETKKSLVQRIVQEKTGMDFGRFTRSILLAQGDFDAFLKADAEQKSKILEQITGTGIYSEISRAVHEKQREEHEKLNILKAEISGITVMNPQREEEILRDLEGERELKIELSAKSSGVNAELTRLISINELEKSISALSDEIEKLELEIQAFAPDKKRLAISLKAAELDGDYANLVAVRNQRKADTRALEDTQNSLSKLQHVYNQSVTDWNLAEKEVQTTKEQLRKAAPLIQRTRILDQRIMEIERRKNICIGECKEDEKQMELDGRIKTREMHRRKKTNESLETLLTYLEENSADKWLLSGLAAIESQLESFLALKKEIEKERKKEDGLEGTLEELDKTSERKSKLVRMQKQALDDIHHRLDESSAELKKVLKEKLPREYRLEKEALLRETAYLARIEELEDQRAQLEDGKPCPLCGARQHPFAEGGTPKTSELEKRIIKLTEIIDGSERWKSRIELLKVSEAEARRSLTENEKLEISMSRDKKSFQENLVGFGERLDRAKKNLSALSNSILKDLRPLGILEIPDSDFLLVSLQQRQRKWMVALEKKADLEKEIAKIDGEIKRLDAVSETKAATLKKKREELEQHQSEYLSTRNVRHKLFGDRDVEAEELRLNEAISNAELREKELRSTHDSAKGKLIAIDNTISSLKRSITKRTSEIAKLESCFNEALLSAGFTSELVFQNSRLTGDERDMLRSEEKKLDDQLTELQVKKKDREAQLELKIAKTTSEDTLEEMQALVKNLDDSLKEKGERIAELKSRLAENAAAKKRIKEKKIILEAQELECGRWGKLHSLIGSADGKKYRNFAQGLTFELVLSHANRQLAKLSDRYLLVRDKKHPLVINVIDSYQADEIRPVKNLSGGESFIASLALALGLSKISSRKVRVDSLFLDEGFGTLDEDSLETALETIAGLRQDGKLIGVISHLPQLKECISTQITVTPLYGGKSTLDGPGCRSR